MNFPPFPTTTNSTLSGVPLQQSQSTGLFSKKNLPMIAIVVLLLALIGAVFLIFQARSKAEKMGGPFSGDIAKVSDTEMREDLKEWHYLWQLSKRKSVKDVIHDILKSHLSTSEPVVIGNPADDPLFDAA